MSSTATAEGPRITVPYSQCTLELCPIEAAQLPYAPNLAGNVLYLGIFGTCLVGNLALGLWFRTWGYLVAMSLGTLLEVLGYVGRVQMHYNPFPQDPFFLYLICVTIASIFLTAAIYLCLSRIVVVYGTHLSFLRPRTYTFLFVLCDFLSLLLQAGGGTMVTMADDLEFSNKGLHVMQAGLVFQVASLLVFIALCAIFIASCRRRSSEFDPRFHKLQNSRRFRTFLWGLGAATLLMLARCTFRVAELSEGFKGRIWFNEIDFMVGEGAMISLCVILLTAGHPGLAFGTTYRDANYPLRKKSDMN
ncbi:putative RTA1 domain protein [Thozetella sp. PMI_491]|nr:putative RTA1 domain protein [Thozetella sp. PMI_491]